MITWIKKLFFADPVQTKKNKISKLYKEYVKMQRNGKLDKAGELMDQITKLENDIRALQNDP